MTKLKTPSKGRGLIRGATLVSCYPLIRGINSLFSGTASDWRRYPRFW